MARLRERHVHVGDGALVVRRPQTLLARLAAEDLGAIQRPQRLGVDGHGLVLVGARLGLERVVDRPREAVLVVVVGDIYIFFPFTRIFGLRELLDEVEGLLVRYGPVRKSTSESGAHHCADVASMAWRRAATI